MRHSVVLILITLLSVSAVFAKKDKNEATEEILIEVVDQNHQPVAGAIVSIEGEEAWLFTDFDGKVRLTLPEGSQVTITVPGDESRSFQYVPAPEENGKLTVTW